MVRPRLAFSSTTNFHIPPTHTQSQWSPPDTSVAACINRTLTSLPNEPYGTHKQPLHHLFPYLQGPTGILYHRLLRSLSLITTARDVTHSYRWPKTTVFPTQQRIIKLKNCINDRDSRLTMRYCMYAWALRTFRASSQKRINDQNVYGTKFVETSILYRFYKKCKYDLRPRKRDIFKKTFSRILTSNI